MTEVVTDIIVTPATIWQAPVGEPLPDETSIAAGAAWGGNWSSIGYTGGPLTVAYEFEVVDVMIEQSLAPVNRKKSSEALRLETTMAELTAAAAKLAFGGGTISTTVAGASQKAFEDLDLGGDADMDEYAWGFEGTYIDQDGAEQPVRFFIYRGTAQAGGELEFGRETQTGIPLQIAALADMTQDQGSRLFKLQRVTAAASS